MLVGVDPAAKLIRIAPVMTNDERLRFSVGRAEQLPFSDACCDLVVATTSFDHWASQRWHRLYKVVLQAVAETN